LIGLNNRSDTKKEALQGFQWGRNLKSKMWQVFVMFLLCRVESGSA
jgi:hypothetical protein